MPSKNKKVKNAKEVIINGITFRSGLEGEIYEYLLKRGITPSYENKEFVVQEKFRPIRKWFLNGNPQITKKGNNNIVQEIKYTPDFTFEYKGYTILLEVKGFPTDRYKIIRKMFLNYLETCSDNLLFVEVRNTKELGITLSKIDTVIGQPCPLSLM